MGHRDSGNRQLGRIGWTRAARGALSVTGAASSASGLLLLTGGENWALRLTNTANSGPGASGLDTAYGLDTIMTGVGLVLAGLAVARARRWHGWARWTPLPLGIPVFVVVLPGIFGTFLEGRLAIMLWLIVWAALGAALIREAGQGRLAAQ